MCNSVLNFVKVFWAYNMGLTYVIQFYCSHEILDSYPLHIALHSFILWDSFIDIPFLL